MSFFFNLFVTYIFTTNRVILVDLNIFWVFMKVSRLFDIVHIRSYKVTFSVKIINIPRYVFVLITTIISYTYTYVDTHIYTHTYIHT